MWCRRNTKPWIWVGLIALLTVRCVKNEPRAVIPAFYHWKTTLALSPAERNYLDSLKCKKLYLKVLDIGLDPLTGAIQPYSRLEVADTAGLSAFEMVPVVFITNEVFKNITEEKIEWLAGKIVETLNPTPGPSPNGRGDVERTATKPALSPERSTSPLPLGEGLGVGLNELQFDCDWTPSTRDAFFLFLKKIKKRLPENTCLSATIRLHQYKFPEKTGVPPVERGMLMFYNTGDIENPEAGNSIFQPADARKYLIGAPNNYPLPLDLALPVFTWALVYREGELWKIIPEMPENELADTTRFKIIQDLHPARPEHRSSLITHHSTFIIQKGTFIAGHYLRPGDLLRVESIPPDLLREAARMAANADLANNATVAFFHLDSAIVRRYRYQLLDSICQVINFPEKKK